LVSQVIDADGLTPVFAAANVDGHVLDPDSYIEVINGAGAPINVTIETGGTLAGLALADVVVVVAAGARAKIGGFDRRAFCRPTGVSDADKIYVNFSSVTTITCAAFR